MREVYEAELRVAQIQGVVSREEAEALLSEGRRQGRSPLDLLMESGVISEETFAELRAAALHAAKPGADAPVPAGEPTLTLEPAIRAAQTPPRPDEPLPLEAPTLTRSPTPAQAAPSSQEPAFPVPGWERYQPVRFLGQGGMGRVYLAYDPLLHRNVALKFVRGDDPDLLRRFVAEARAQARVDHERVCKVYEVGEVKGQPFIAMQYVNGRSLLEVARELPLEQMLMVVQQATEGVHAAHRAGLIHRDIKPANILVERGEDGRWKPYVMDFGLARSWQREATVTGTVLGTPHYMAPEQARGDQGQLDRRADVYSLGATLYMLLTGQPPIPGSNALEVLSNLLTREPRPLRQLKKNVPVDLEAIVLKCLEREPSARYDSARALAEDLGRFLNGEPVQARTVGTWYRLRKRARKHRALVSMATVALVLVSLALGQLVRTRRDASLREDLVRQFTELSTEVAARARLIALSRLHDTSTERQELRTKLEKHEAEIQQSGELALAPGHYALGQGWLELGDPTKAVEHLQAAYRYAPEDSRVASALALALGQLYDEHLRSEQLSSDLFMGPSFARQRQARREELALLYRKPALELLYKLPMQKGGQNALALPAEYMEALLAFYEEHYDDALARLDVLGERLPWFYEVPKLRGDILHMRALERWDDGGRTDEERAHVQADLKTARQAYTRAADIAQSSPEVHCGLARVEWAEATMGLHGRDETPLHLERALDHLSRALQVAPDHTASWVLRATLYRNLAKSSQGSEAEEPLRKAIESARGALTLSPSSLEARKELGMDLWALASNHEARGLDPREHLRQAFEMFESIEPGKRDYYIHHGLALTFMTWANYEDQIGKDSLSNRNKAIEAFRQVLQINDQYQPAWLNLALQYFRRAAHTQAPAADEDLQQALHALEQSQSLDPDSGNTTAHQHAARIHLLRAQRLRNAGEDERPELTAALVSCQKGISIDSGVAPLHNLAGWALLDQARGARARGVNPLPLLKQAQKSFERARDVAPQAQLAYDNLADVQAERAMYLHARAHDPRPSARAALKAALEAQQRAPDHHFPLINLGHAFQLLAAFALEARGDPGPHLAEATKTLQQALQKAPNNAEALLYLAETRAVQARWQAQQGRGEDKNFQEAAQTYERSLEQAERPLDYRLALGRFCREWAAWRQQAGLDPRPPLEQGLRLAEAVLAVQPDWADAQALRASLQALSGIKNPSQ